MNPNEIYTVGRELYYEITLEIDPESYQRTYTDDHGHCWRYEESKGQLAGVVERAISRETNASLEALDISPGFLRARVSPDRDGTRPKNVVSSLARVEATWREEFAKHVDGEPVDDITFSGDRLTEVVRSEDSAGPEGFIEDVCTPAPDDVPEGAPDPGVGPVVELGPGVEPPDVPADDRHLPVTAVVPIDPETYREVSADRLDDTTWKFVWDDDAVNQFRRFVDRTRWHADWLLSVHPYYLRVDTLSGSMAKTPAEATVGELEPVVRQFNSHRPVLDVQPAGSDVAQRPELQVDRVAYVGATTTAAATDDWIRARGLEERTGEPVDPPEPDPAPDGGDGDGGLLGSLGLN